MLISPQCISKDLRVRPAHCGIISEHYAVGNYGNLPAMSHKLNTKPAWRHCGVTRPKITLHFVVINPAINVHIVVSTKIALHLI